MSDETRDSDWEERSANYETANSAAALAPWLIALLACPVDQSTLAPAGGDLVCNVCGRLYPVRNGIPVMLAHDAGSEQEF